MIRRAIELNSSEAIYHIGLGVLLEARQATSAAIDEFSIAATLDPKFIKSSLFHSLALEQPLQAEIIIQKSTSILREQAASTQSPITMARLGALFEETGHTSEAITMLENAVTSLPGLPFAWENLGYAYEAVGAPLRADSCFKKSEFLRGINATANRIVSGNQRHVLVSEHSARIGRLYMTSPLEDDDLLPPGFLAACAPINDHQGTNKGKSIRRQ